MALTTPVDLMAPAPRRTSRFAGRALVASLLLAAAAPAQGVPAAEAEARRLFDRGVFLIEADRPADAIRVLEQARRIREVPAVVYNLALAQSAVGRNVDALASFDAYLRLAGARLPSARRAAVEGLIASTRQHIAAVTVRVPGPSVAVAVDGVAIPPARLGRPVELDPGQHVFRATRPGLRPVEVARYFAAGARVDLELSPEPLPATGTLRVASLIPGASIYVDGALAGVGSIERPASPGRHTVALRADGYDPAESVVQLAAGQTEQLRLSLTRRRSLLTQWWFWTGIGVLATAGATALVIGLSSTEPPSGGTQGFVIQAISGR